VRPGIRDLLEDLRAAELAVVLPRVRPAQALERLRALELGIDEVALEVRRQDARARRPFAIGASRRA
jgi:hypothetical protein